MKVEVATGLLFQCSGSITLSPINFFGQPFDEKLSRREIDPTNFHFQRSIANPDLTAHRNVKRAGDDRVANELTNSQIQQRKRSLNFRSLSIHRT